MRTGIDNGYTFVSADPAALARLAQRRIPVELVQWTHGQLHFVVSRSHARTALADLRSSNLLVETVPECAKIVAVIRGLSSLGGVLYESATKFATQEIALLHYSDSGAVMTFVVAETQSQRAHAALREVLAEHSGQRRGGALEIDLRRGCVVAHGRTHQLGLRETQLLTYLIERGSRATTTAEELARHLFGTAGEERIAALRVHLHKLRKKLEIDPHHPRYLVTVPGAGYALRR